MFYRVYIFVKNFRTLSVDKRIYGILMLFIWVIYILIHIAFIWMERYIDKRNLTEVQNRVIVVLGVAIILCVFIGGMI